MSLSNEPKLCGSLIYASCHGDIKPENILWVNGKLKIADPGEASIEVSTTPDSSETHMVGGTVTYGMTPISSSVGISGQLSLTV